MQNVKKVPIPITPAPKGQQAKIPIAGCLVQSGPGIYQIQPVQNMSNRAKRIPVKRITAEPDNGSGKNLKFKKYD